MSALKKIRLLLGIWLALGWSAAVDAALIGRGGGLIYDDVLNVTWMQDTTLSVGSSYDDGGNTNDGRMSWGNARDWAANLDFYDSVRNIT